MFAKAIDEMRWTAYLGLLIGPEYMFRPIYLRSANVLERIEPRQAREKMIGWGYMLKVRFDWHQDSQTLYSPGWQERRGYVKVSRRLFQAKPHHVNIFCQYSRRVNHTNSVCCWIAK